MSLFSSTQAMEFLKGLLIKVGLGTKKTCNVYTGNKSHNSETENTVNSKQANYFANLFERVGSSSGKICPIKSKMKKALAKNEEQNFSR